MSITRTTALLGFLVATVVHPCVQAGDSGEALRADFMRAFEARPVAGSVVTRRAVAHDPRYRLVTHSLRSDPRPAGASPTDRARDAAPGDDPLAAAINDALWTR